MKIPRLFAAHNGRRELFSKLLIISTAALCLVTCLAPQQSLASAFDPDTYEISAKSWKDDWLYPLRQNKAANVIQNVDSTPWHARVGVETRQFQYEISKSSENTLTYLPNTSSYLNLSLSHSKYFGISFSSNSGAPENPSVYGTSDYKDIRIELPHDRWMFSAGYARYRGFYVENDKSPIKSIEVLPNMGARTFTLNAIFMATPHRFSLPSQVAQTARQTASGGSAFVGLALRDETVENSDGSFVTASFAEERMLQDAGELKKISSTSISPVLGYAYQYNFTAKFSISGGIALGYGFARVRTNNGAPETQGITKGDASVALAYNGDINYYGFRITDDTETVTSKGVDLASTLERSLVYYGRRF
jgi:hypothetical protein